MRLSSVSDRWLHSEGAAERARGIEGVVADEDRELLVAAAYLHDIGYATQLGHFGFHPLDGACWLRGQGLERLAGLVAHHTAARFEALARGLAGELRAFRDERSMVSDALAYSDLTTGPDGQRVSVAERLGEIERRYGPSSLVVQALQAASGALHAMVLRTEQRLTAEGAAR